MICNSLPLTYSAHEEANDPKAMIPIPAPIHSIVAMVALLGSIASYFAAQFAKAHEHFSMLADGSLPENGILGSNYLVALCLAGSLGGSIVFVLAFCQNDSRRQVCSKLLICSILGMIATPSIIMWRGWPEIPEVVLSAAGGVSLLSYTVLLQLFPWVVGKITTPLKTDPNKP